MPAPRTSKRFTDEAAVIEWLQRRRPGATVTVKPLRRYREGTLQFSYETDEVKGHVTFAEGGGAGDLSVGGLDLYQWSSGPPWFGGKPRFQWEENK